MQRSPPCFLIGGGWDRPANRAHYAMFISACPSSKPVVGCVVLDEGDGRACFDRFAAALSEAGDCIPRPILVARGTLWDGATLDGLDGLFVCAGLTPGYHDALAPAAETIRSWLSDGGRPYAGFSAGAAIASDFALVGGWQIDGRVVCPEDAAEDLDPVTVRPGLGLIPMTIDVHCAQWGTLSRLVSALGRGLVHCGVALDEDTMLYHHNHEATVFGRGHAWLVTARNSEVHVRSFTDGQAIPVPYTLGDQE